MNLTRFHGDYEWHDPASEDEVVAITYVNRDGTEVNIRGKIGDNVMYLAHRHEIDIEGYQLFMSISIWVSFSVTVCSLFT